MSVNLLCDGWNSSVTSRKTKSAQVRYGWEVPELIRLVFWSRGVLQNVEQKDRIVMK